MAPTRVHSIQSMSFVGLPEILTEAPMEPLDYKQVGLRPSACSFLSHRWQSSLGLAAASRGEHLGSLARARLRLGC